MAEFSPFGFQKLATRGRIEKQILGHHDGAAFEGGRFRRGQVAADGFDARAVRRTGETARNRQARYGSKACQRLAAKSEADDMFEVVECLYLAGRVACECQWQFADFNTMAIVRHADPFYAALHEFDVDL